MDHARFGMGTNPVALFEESYGIRACEEDPVGAAAEADFRLAVVAQALDRDYPVSRLLFAGTRPALERFVRSGAFRACFTESRRTVLKAFREWAIAEAGSRDDPSLQAVLAVEAAGASAGTHRLPGLPDLSEARFAVRALRRHLADRAFATGVLELNALEQLAQVVRRCLPASG